MTGPQAEAPTHRRAEAFRPSWPGVVVGKERVGPPERKTLQRPLHPPDTRPLRSRLRAGRTLLSLGGPSSAGAGRGRAGGAAANRDSAI